MHPLVENIIRQLSENEYLVKLKNGDVAVWNVNQPVEEEADVQELEYILAVAG